MENSSFSVKENAGKSFKTFILTLSVSLIIFSAVYYVMTINSSKQESFDVSLGKQSAQKEAVAGASDTTKSVFKEIASKNPGVLPKEVLAGSTVATGTTPVTQTTGSVATVPQTGTVSITFGLIAAFTMFLTALVIVFNNPRRLALLSFEKSALKDIEDKN
jgi:hypothetical protein